MALKRPYLDDHEDRDEPEAYWRIIGLTQENRLDVSLDPPAVVPLGSITVAVYRSTSSAGKSEKKPVAVKVYPLNEQTTRDVFGMQKPRPRAVVPKNRAYAYLKSLPEFAEAEDV